MPVQFSHFSHKTGSLNQGLVAPLSGTNGLRTTQVPVPTNCATQLPVPVKCSVHKPDFSQFGADLLNNCTLFYWKEQKKCVYILVMESSSSIKQTQNDSVHYLFCNYGVEINLKIMFIPFQIFFLDFDSSTTVPLTFTYQQTAHTR
jgi:hypothetical protein